MVDQLRIARGWVRCGQCRLIYKAYDTITLDTEQTTSNVLERPPKTQDAPQIKHSSVRLVEDKEEQVQQATQKTEEDHTDLKDNSLLTDSDLWALSPDTEIFYETSDSEELTAEPISNDREEFEQDAIDNSAKLLIDKKEQVQHSVQATEEDNTDLKDNSLLKDSDLWALSPDTEIFYETSDSEELTAEPISNNREEFKQDSIDNSTNSEILATPEQKSTALPDKSADAISDSTSSTDQLLEKDLQRLKKLKYLKYRKKKQQKLHKKKTTKSDTTSSKLSKLISKQKTLPDTTEDLSFIRKSQKRAFWTKPSTRTALICGILLMCLSLTTQMLYHWRSAIYAQVPISRKVFDTVCKLTGCSIAPWKNIKAISIENSYFRELTYEGYSLGLSLRNNDSHRVAMPALELILLDYNEQILVRRIITDLPAPSSLPPHGEWHGTIAFNLKLSPALQQRGLAGYRVSLFYASAPAP